MLMRSPAGLDLARLSPHVLKSALKPVLVVLVLTAAAWGHRYKLVIVDGDSMLPSLHHSDLLVVDRFAYRRRRPARGDVAVALYREELIIKRIVGLPGEELELRDGVLYVDGSPQLQNPRPESGGLDIRRGLLVGQKYALLGDNQALVSEPTAHAVVSPHEIVGRVAHVLRWPGSAAARWHSQEP